MGKIALMFFFSLLLFSCEKDYLIPDNEVPDWLKARIDKDEQYIFDHPSSCLIFREVSYLVLIRCSRIYGFETQEQV